MRRRLSSAVLALISVAVVALTAQSVVLVPGTISGSLALAGITLDQVSVSAYPTSGGNNSSVSVSPNATSGSYSLTVGVPQSGTQTFNISAAFYSDQYRDYLQTPASQIAVSAAVPGQQNFNLTNVGFVAATISVSGGILQSAFVQASQGSQYAYTSAATSYGFTFPALPATNTTISGTAYLTDGRQLSLPNQIVNIVAGETTAVSFTLAAPTNSGSIAGTIQFSGSTSPNQIYAYASGPMFRSIVLNPPPADGSYLIDNLVAGNYSLGAYIYLNNSDDYFQFPSAAFTPGNSVTVGTSQKVINVQADQAFINSQLTLTGAPTFLPWVYNGTLGFAGVSAATSGGYSQDQLSTSSSSFDSIVSPGPWRQDFVSVFFYRQAPYLFNYFYFYDNRPTAQVSVAAGETKSRNVDVPLGELTIGVSTSGGALMSSPSVSGSCTYRDASNTQLWSSYVYASNNATNVSTTQLTFAAPAGTCSLSVSASVNGSYVSLPSSTFQIVAGASQVVDIGGPTLTIASPGADAILNSSFVSVSGKATDDVAVASVTVNGTAVSLSPTGNVNDPAEVSFQRTVSGLQKGPNTITTIASDTSSPAKTTTDTRTIFYDTALPNLIFTPADGSSTFASSVTVTGTADDDAGVKKITINGTDTSFSSTSNSSLPNQVSFTGPVSLSPGSNSIVVVVTDISNRTITQTHTVTRQQQAPTALSVDEASAAFGGTVSLSATLTSQSSGVAGKTVHFTVNGNSADGVTDASGVATVGGLNVGGLNVGIYPSGITASFAGDTNFGSSNGSAQLTITKASATMTLGNLTQTYGGTMRTASVTTTPTGLTGVSLTYNGSPTAPTNAGSYTVVASLTNANYDAPNATATLIISKASATLALSNLTYVYDASPKVPTVTTSPAGLSGVFLSYDGSPTAPTNAGSYAVVASLNNGNYQADNATGTLVIGKASATLSLSNLTHTYDGSPRAVTVTTSPASLTSVAVSYNGSPAVPSDAGSYAVVASLTNVNYTASDASGTLTIAKANQTISFGMLSNRTFGDPDFGVTASSSSGAAVSFAAYSGSCSVTGSSVHLTGAGSCTIRASQGGNGNYNAAADVDRSFTIAKANQSLNITTGVPGSATYNTTFNTVATGGGSANPVIITAGGACSVSSGGSGAAIIIMTSGSGTCTVSYNQAGDGNYLAAPQLSGTTSALKGAQTITVTTAAPSTAAYATSFTVAANGGGSGNPVTYSSPANDGCSDLGPTFTVISGMNACQIVFSQAGNTNYNAAAPVTQSVNVIGYLFDGFFQPIDMSVGSTMVWNSGTAGQAIPVKWRLTLTGAPVSAVSSYVAMYSAEVTCGSGTGSLEDAIEEYASGASSVIYDGDGYFHINWKTLTNYKGKCRAFYLGFSDGSTSNVAYFKFK